MRAAIDELRPSRYSARSKSGSNAFALTNASRTDHQTRTELGARFDYALPVQDALRTADSLLVSAGA